MTRIEKLARLADSLLAAGAEENPDLVAELITEVEELLAPAPRPSTGVRGYFAVDEQRTMPGQVVLTSRVGNETLARIYVRATFFGPVVVSLPHRLKGAWADYVPVLGRWLAGRR
jgi:hypothetical protein